MSAQECQADRRAGCLYCGAESQNQTAVTFDTDRGNYVYARICGPAHMGAARGKAGRIEAQIWEEIGEEHAEFCTALDDGEPCELGDCDGAHERTADRLHELIEEEERAMAARYDENPDAALEWAIADEQEC